MISDIASVISVLRESEEMLMEFSRMTEEYARTVQMESDQRTCKYSALLKVSTLSIGLAVTQDVYINAIRRNMDLLNKIEEKSNSISSDETH